MATPKNATILRGAPLKCGVILGISPSSDPTFDVELVRATSGVYSTVARLTNLSGGIPVTYEDLLPNTTQHYSYKARAVKQGWLAGDYTAVLEVQPLQMPEILPKITPLTGKGIGSPLFISTGSPPQYGQAALQQYYEGGIQVRTYEFSSTAPDGYRATPYLLYPTSTLARKFFWTSRLPEGAENVTIDFSYRRPSTKGSLVFRFGKDAPALSWFVDYTATGTTGTYAKTFSSGFDIPTGYGAWCQVDITSTSGSTASVVMISPSFTYFKPTVAVAV